MMGALDDVSVVAVVVFCVARQLAAVPILFAVARAAPRASRKLD